MAKELVVLDYSFPAGADLSGSQYFLVALNSSKQVVLVAAAGGPVLGVLQNNPTSGRSATVRLFGISNVVSGATTAVGDALASTSAGKAKTASALVQATGAASQVFGYGLEASASGQIFTALVMPGIGVVPTSFA